MARRKTGTYSADVRAAVVAALLAGATHKEVQEQYGPHKITQKRWIADYQNDETQLVELKKQESIGDLIVQYSTVLFRTLTVQAETFGNTDWILAQDADKAAILHGVLADKGSLILERLAELQRIQEQRIIDAE